MSHSIDHDHESDTTRPTETKSLASLPGLRGPDYEESCFDDRASHYSLSELSETNPVRRVAAVEVRRQALAFPPRPNRSCKYPKEFHNIEQMLLCVPGPWIEYPLLANGRHISGEPGPARVIVSADDFAGADVVYHPGKSRRDFKLANYRPRGRQHAVSRYFVTESSYPLYPSMTTNWYPTSFHEGYAAYHGFEWQGQELGQAPWLVAAHMSAQPWYGVPMQPVYQQGSNPYMGAPMPYGFYQYPIFNLSEVKGREY
ncbi:hypothetical protein CEP52_013254 [Fusarium oligoseptatum]|uniref:Uncharacterized protein n=1 Tax=Fusarium oligoseptatum TaxID=2604345 RepID=A0A428SUM9_9HYPO|nr:hypothetical protein CEP52_013254 [Fusarium oligoseptatum]